MRVSRRPQRGVSQVTYTIHIHREEGVKKSLTFVDVMHEIPEVKV